jgi:hypothetical protein
MKLCPLFESVWESNDTHAPTMTLCNEALPREAIAAAIPLLVAHGKELLAQRYEGAPGSIYRQLADELIEKNRKHVEQLQALLPKEGNDNAG